MPTVTQDNHVKDMALRSQRRPEPLQKRPGRLERLAGIVGNILAPAFCLGGKRVKQRQSFGVQGFPDVEFGRCIEGAAHFLHAQKQGETGIEPARQGWVSAPILGGENGRRALSRAETIERLTPVIAKLLAPGMNAAAEIGGEMMAGLSGCLVVPELSATLEGQRCATKREALAAIGGKIRFHFDTDP